MKKIISLSLVLVVMAFATTSFSAAAKKVVASRPQVVRVSFVIYSNYNSVLGSGSQDITISGCADPSSAVGMLNISRSVSLIWANSISRVDTSYVVISTGNCGPSHS